MIANLCASALKSGAKVILSEDMNSGQSIAGIQQSDSRKFPLLFALRRGIVDAACFRVRNGP
jgi:hypothetical protein